MADASIVEEPREGDRQNYEEWQRELLRRKYHLCKNNKDRWRLFQEAGITTMARGYNLACREGCTRPHGNKVSKRAKETLTPYDPRKDVLVHLRRDNPETLRFPADDDEFIVEHWHCNYIEEIAVFINCSPTAVAYRARQLGLRRVPRYYDTMKVMAWLGVSFQELSELVTEWDPIEGQERSMLLPCTDRREKIKIMLVPTMSLARGLAKQFTYRRLIAERGADRFFVRDVLEGVTEIADGTSEWEACHWVGYDHTSLNPYDMATFGLRYDGDEASGSSETQQAAAFRRQLDPRALAPSQHVASDTWRPDNWKRRSVLEAARRARIQVPA